MTLVSQIIVDAYRMSNLLAISTAPTTAQQDEALRYLNRIVKSVFGNEAGDPLTAFPVGNNNYQRPSGYPWWNTVPDNDWFVPKNTRVVLNVNTADINLYLHPAPDNGSRFAAIDQSGTLATYPVTVYGNGATIEGQLSLILNTNDFDAEWFYREDLGDWTRYSPLLASDNFPFPEEFDDYFIALLAMRLNPAYGTSMDDQSAAVMQRSGKQLRARYTQVIQTRSELGLIRHSKVAADRDQWGNQYWLYQPNDMFDKGWPW